MIAKIASQAVYVSDQSSAEKFWKEKVGFEVCMKVEMAPGLYWLEVSPPGAETHLVLYPQSLMKDWKERRSSIVFECNDVDVTYAMLKESGVKVGKPPQQMQWGKFSTFQDPDGNEFVMKS
jgi:lactoylglutathione lyase